MEKFEVLTVEDNEDFWFVLGRKHGIGVAFNIRFDLQNRKWRCLAGIKSWNQFSLINKTFEMTFKQIDEKLTDEQLNKINELFYELLRQIKQDPSYRLKVMHILTDEMRELWDAV